MEAFQLRLWDGRIGRWLSPDPYGQYASPYLGMGNDPIGLVDPDGGSTEDWHKDKNGVTRFDSSVKNQADVDGISPGGKYIAPAFSTKTANYYSDGSAFFKNEHEGYKFMLDNSNMQTGNNEVEHFGFITTDGVAVLPREGKNVWGNNFKNTSLHSEGNIKGYMILGTGKNLTVNFNTQTLKPIAWIHTHPDSFGGFEQSLGDIQTTKKIGVPSIVLGRKYVYALSVKNAIKFLENRKNFTISQPMTIKELRTGTISLKDNIHLLK